MAIITYPPQPSGGDPTLSKYFSEYGQFPFVAGNATDLIVSASTTWTDDVRVRRFRKLTINAGVKVSIRYSPCIIFAEEISFGSTTSIISADGETATSTTTEFTGGTAKGSSQIHSNNVYRAFGGCGGGFLVVVCNKITGSAGQITANGGNGYIYAPTVASWSNSSTNSAQGALTLGYMIRHDIMLTPITGPSLTGDGNEFNIVGFQRRLDKLLGKGGSNYENQRARQGSIYSVNESAYGASGFGGGAYSDYNNKQWYHGSPPELTPTTDEMLKLFTLDMKGGGGGGKIAQSIGTSYDSSCAGGGGGGGIILFYRKAQSLPVLRANGGSGVVSYPAAYTPANGGAGVTHIVQV